jgi:hypothetical protein
MSEKFSIKDAKDWIRAFNRDLENWAPRSHYLAGRLDTAVNIIELLIECEPVAAQEKLNRLILLRNDWEKDDHDYLNTYGQHIAASLACLVEQFDKALKGEVQ